MEKLMSNQTTQAKPEVKLPKAVMAQRDRADELLKAEMDRKLKEKETPQSAQSDVTAEPKPVSTPEATAPATPAPAEPEKDAKYWEHRFKTSQGMFEAEKTRLRTENANLKERQSGFEAQLRELTDRVRAAERQAPKDVDLGKYLNKEQIETYGPEVLQSVVKVATLAAEEASERRVQEELDRQINPVKAELDEARNNVIAAKEEAFWGNLEKSLPNWALINDDPAFREWLNGRDPFSGFRRQDILTQAQKALDSNRVVAVFEAFTNGSSAPKTVQAPVSQAPRIVPEPVATTPTIPQVSVNNAPAVSRAEISEHYKRAAIGWYKYRPQEKEAMEKKIRAAQLAGTVY